MRTIGRARFLLIAAFAGSGVLVAHWLGYRATAHSHGDHEHAARLLAQTGHSYFNYLAALVVAASMLLLMVYVSHRLRSAAPTAGGLRLVRYGALRLLPVQAAAFVGLEMLERTLFTGGLTNVLHEPAVQVGLVLQLVVALVAAVLLGVFARVVEALRTRGVKPTFETTLVIEPSARWFTPRLVALGAGGIGLRGPPSLL